MHVIAYDSGIACKACKLLLGIFEQDQHWDSWHGSGLWLHITWKGYPGGIQEIFRRYLRALCNDPCDCILHVIDLPCGGRQLLCSSLLPQLHCFNWKSHSYLPQYLTQGLNILFNILLYINSHGVSLFENWLIELGQRSQVHAWL